MTIEQQLTLLAEAIHGNAWGIAQLKPRIYFKNHRKDVKVFISFSDACFTRGDQNWQDDSASLGGATLQVQIADCGQHGSWYSSQREKIEKAYRAEFSAVSIADAFFGSGIYDAEKIHLAMAEVMAADIDAMYDDASINAFAHEAINGRVEEAMAIIRSHTPELAAN